MKYAKYSNEVTIGGLINSVWEDGEAMKDLYPSWIWKTAFAQVTCSSVREKDAVFKSVEIALSVLCAGNHK